MKNKIALFSILMCVISIPSTFDAHAQANHDHYQQSACSGTSIIFDYSPTDLDKILFIEPMGSVHGDHVTPIDHQYYKTADHWTYPNEKITADVYAPADGVITEIQHMGSFRGDTDHPPMDDYRITIQHTCTISSLFIHIDNPVEKIVKASSKSGESTRANVPVRAGEQIGTFTGSLDYNVVDTEVNLTGFVIPENYQSEAWKIHTKDPFDYFNPSIQRTMIFKSLRTAKPEGGKIDYDIDGRLVGNWFEEGTHGYAGLNQNRYWAGHLSIVYDSIDPEHIIVSIGTYQGRAQQFGVKGNAPDPANVETGTGLVKYELTHYNFYDGQNFWDFKTLRKGLKIRNDGYIQGVALFELIDQRKLKAEFFPGKKAHEVTDFTNTALIYER